MLLKTKKLSRDVDVKGLSIVSRAGGLACVQEIWKNVRVLKTTAMTFVVKLDPRSGPFLINR